MIYLIVVTLLIIFGIGVLIFSYRPEQPRPPETPRDYSGLYHLQELRQQWEDPARRTWLRRMIFGMELAAIWKRRTGRSQDVTVNVRNAVCNLAAMLYAKQNGVTVPFDDAGLVETTDYFRCKDGRWVFIVCSLPRLRQIACAVLDCQATHKAFAERCLQWNALELEEAMSAAGGCCATARTREEWFASEQGKITMAEPLISIQKIGDSDPIPFTDGCELPLSGIRVLDNTQIYAGPICARYASDAGADVLHLVKPMMPRRRWRCRRFICRSRPGRSTARRTRSPS